MDDQADKGNAELMIKHAHNLKKLTKKLGGATVNKMSHIWQCYILYDNRKQMLY